jgi:hypothetical protein
LQTADNVDLLFVRHHDFGIYGDATPLFAGREAATMDESHFVHSAFEDTFFPYDIDFGSVFDFESGFGLGPE